MWRFAPHSSPSAPEPRVLGRATERRPWVLVSSTRMTRSEEHTSELQSLMRISYAVFCLKKKKNKEKTTASRYNTHTYRKPSIHTQHNKKHTQHNKTLNIKLSNKTYNTH